MPGNHRKIPCPVCGEPMTNRAQQCKACDSLQRLVTARPRTAPPCPECGGVMSRGALRCSHCAGRRANRQGGADRGGVNYAGRGESNITFRHVETGALQSRHCVGRGRPAQIRHGLAQGLGEGWVVETVSTPASILADLQKTAP